MMRELKFRAWNEGNKKMLLAFDLTQNPKYCWAENKDYPLMQYTGLKDKNGKEVWEGDVIQDAQDHLFQVMFGKNFQSTIDSVYQDIDWETVGFYLDPIALTCYCNIYNFVDYVRKGLVVANIYENPELLRQSDV